VTVTYNNPQIVPFGMFAPDQSRFNPQASAYTVNCMPTMDGWGPIKGFSSVGGAAAAEPRGMISVKNDNGVYKVYFGTPAKLYEISTANYAYNDVTRAVGGDYSLADDEYWSFALFGSILVATAIGSTVPQFIDVNTGTQFAALTNASFEARHVAAVGDFLVFGAVDTGDGLNERLLKWSGVNDATSWTIQERGSDEQEIPAGGKIQGILPQYRDALLIQERRISGMQFDSSAGTVFRFQTLVPDRGAFAPRSIVSIAPNDFIYLTEDGFYRGLESRPIGAERVDKFFFNTALSSQWDRVSAQRDPFNKIVWFRFKTGVSSNEVMGYDYQLDRWCYAPGLDALLLSSVATPGYDVDSTAAVVTQYNVDNSPYGPDSRFWRGGIPAFAGFNSSYEFGFFDGANLQAILETEDRALRYPRRAVTERVAALVGSNDWSVAISGIETQGATPSFGAYVAKETAHPFASTQVSGRLHRFRIKIPAGSTWDNAVGLSIYHRDGGMW